MTSIMGPASATHIRAAVGTAVYNPTAKTVTLTSTMAERKDACPTLGSGTLCTFFAFPTITQVDRNTGSTVATISKCTGQNTTGSQTYDNTSQPLYNIFTSVFVIDVSCPAFNPNFDYIFSQVATARIGGIKNTTNQTVDFETRIRIDGVNSVATPLYNSSLLTNVPYDASPSTTFSINLNALDYQGKSVTYSLITNSASALGGYGASKIPCSDLNSTTGLFRISASLCTGTENYATAFSGGTDAAPIYYALKTKATDSQGQFTTRDVLFAIAGTTDNAPTITRSPTPASITVTPGTTKVVTFTASDVDPGTNITFATNTLPAWATYVASATTGTTPRVATFTLTLAPPIGTNTATSIQVTAIDDPIFQLSATSQLDVTVGSALLPPGQPQNPAATTSGTTLTATFNPPTTGGTVANYVVLATPVNGGSTITGPSCNASPCTVTVTSGVAYSVVIQAVNASGTANSNSVNTTLSVPSLVLSPTTLTLTQNQAISGSPLTYTSYGTAITSYSISPAPVAGLSFNTSTGQLSGTPTATTAGTLYTITAKDATNQSTTVTFTLIVNSSSVAQTITFPGNGWGVQMSPAPTATASSPLPTTALPLAAYASSGLAISYSTSSTGCSIKTQGGYSYILYTRSSQNSTTRSCSVTASQAGGTLNGVTYSAATSKTTSFIFYRGSNGWNASPAPSITPTPAAPSVKTIVSVPSPFAISVGTKVNNPLTYTANINTFAWTNCTVSPTLPTGMSFDTVICQPTGTPSVASGNTTYTISFKNPAGTSTGTFNMQVTKGSQTISFNGPADGSVSDTRALSATATSGLSVSFTSNTPNVCTVSGTTLTLIAAGTCTVKASQAGNANYLAASDVTQSLTVSAPNIAPSISISGGEVTLTAKTYTAPWYSIDTTAGGNPTSYTLLKADGTSDLDTDGKTVLDPDGLMFDPATGLISGTPEGGQDRTPYIIRATNAQGTSDASVYITVNKLDQTMSFDVLSAMVLNDPNQNLSALTSSGLTPTYNTDDSNICTIDNGTVDAIAAGYCTVTASQAGNDTYNAATPISRTFVISSALVAPSISLTNDSAAITLGQYFSLPYDVINSGGKIASFSISPSAPPGVVFDTSYGVFSNGQALNAQDPTTYTITATNAAGTSSATFTLTVVKQIQLLALSAPSDMTVGVTADATLSTVSTAGLSSFSYQASPSSVCTLVAGKLHAVAYGTCTVSVTEAGNASYDSATVSTTVNIHQAPTLKIATTASPAASVDVTLRDGQVVNSNLYTLIPTGDPGTSTQYTLFDMTSPTPVDLTTDGINTLDLDQSTGQLSGVVSGGAVARTGYTIKYTNAYGTASVSLYITILAGSAPSLSLSSTSISSPVYTDIGTPFTVLNTGSDASSFALTGTLPTGLSFDTTSGQISGIPTQVKAATSYSITGTNIYGTSAAATFTLTITKATPVITWASPDAITYGAALSGTQLNATADVDGTFVYSVPTATPAAGAILNAGAQTLTASFTPTDSTNYISTTKSVTFTVNKANPVITWANPDAITYGTALSGTQLNATADVAGTFAYAGNPAGTVLNAGANVLSTTFTPSSSNYNSVSATVPLTVNKATADISVTGLNKTYTGSAQSVSVTTTPNGLTRAITYNGSPNAPTDAGTYTVVVTIIDADYQGTTTQSLVIAKATPSITWGSPGSITYGTALSDTQLNASSSVNGSFTYSAPSATPATGVVLNAGLHTLTASFTPTDAANYNSASKSVSITVNKATPVITWATPDAISYGSALSGTQLNASADVDGDFVYSVPGATPASGVVLPAGQNTLTASFTPTDTANYETTSLSVSIMVNERVKATPSITWANPDPITYGTALSGDQLNATTGVTGSFVYSVPTATPAAGVVLGAGLHTVTAVFTPTDSSSYATVTSTVTITVNKANPVITWATPDAITYGTALSDTQLNASASVGGSIVYSAPSATPAAGIVLGAGVRTLTATFTPTNSANYNTVSKSVSITVNKADPILSWASPSPITYGTALSSDQLNASSEIDGTFSYESNAEGTVLNAGANMLSASFTPTDSANYNSGSVSTSLTVNKANAGITVTGLSKTYNGSAQSVSVSTTPNSLVTTTTYDGSNTVPTNAGTYSVVVTVVDTNYQGSTTKSFTISKVTPTITWASPSSITYGTALSGTQLNASTGVAGSFAYVAPSATPASGTVLPAGAHLLTASFTPTDTTNYNNASKSVSITVNKATPIITWASPDAITEGDALSGTQLNASTGVSGSFTYAVATATPAAGVILPVGTHTLNASFAPSDTANYTNASASVQITVNQLVAQVSWPSPDPIEYGVALSADELNATANVPGKFVYAAPSATPAFNIILPVGTHTLTVTFTPTNLAKFSVVTKTVQITVTKSSPFVDWPPIMPIKTGTALTSAQLNAKAAMPGTFAYALPNSSPAGGAILPLGNTTVTVTYTPTDQTLYKPITVSRNVLVIPAPSTKKITPKIVWPNPTPIAFGNPITDTQLNASVLDGIPGTFSYGSNPSGTYYQAGNLRLYTVFTPSDLTRYNVVVGQTFFGVGRDWVDVSYATPAPIRFGQVFLGQDLKLRAVGRNYTGFIAGSFQLVGVNTRLSIGNANIRVRFIPVDKRNFSMSIIDIPVTIMPKITPTMIWNQPAKMVNGSVLSGTQLNATVSDGGSGTITYSVPAGTTVKTGALRVTATFTPDDTITYNVVKMTYTITVTRQ